MKPDKKIREIRERVMSKVKTGEVEMKPRWYFVAGSVLAWTGLVVVSVGAVFWSNLGWFWLRVRGPMMGHRLVVMVGSFPWWVLGLAVITMGVGVGLLKRYDFSYKKNFALVVVGFVTAVLVAGLLVDRMGVNEMWSRRGPTKGLYRYLKIYEKMPEDVPERMPMRMRR